MVVSSLTWRSQPLGRSVPRPRGLEGAANGAAAAAEDLPIEAPLRRKLEAFLAPFNRELAARTGIQF